MNLCELALRSGFYRIFFLSNRKKPEKCIWCIIKNSYIPPTLLPLFIPSKFHRIIMNFIVWRMVWRKYWQLEVSTFSASIYIHLLLFYHTKLYTLGKIICSDFYILIFHSLFKLTPSIFEHMILSIMLFISQFGSLLCKSWLTHFVNMSHVPYVQTKTNIYDNS